MARVSKPSSLRTDRKISKAELKKREEIEQQLMGNADDVHSVPAYLTDYEKIYYTWLVNELKETNLITNIDKPLLEQTANCLHIMRQCDEHIRANGILVEKTDRYGNCEERENPSIKIKLNYQTKYASLCNQLGLSPAARASLANKAAMQAQQEADPMYQLLSGGM